MKALIILSFVLFCVGCSSQQLTEEQRYDRENKETLRIERYYRDKADCEARGDKLYVERHSGLSKFGRDKPPKWDEGYSCMTDWEFQRLIRQLQGRTY